jgi:hypothetical protein
LYRGVMLSAISYPGTVESLNTVKMRGKAYIANDERYWSVRFRYVYEPMSPFHDENNFNQFCF